MGHVCQAIYEINASFNVCFVFCNKRMLQYKEKLYFTTYLHQHKTKCIQNGAVL